jgi:glycosyltransferase involved in cell wall biosynthesis
MRNTKHFHGLLGIYRYWFGNQITRRSIKNASAVVSIAGEYIPKVMGKLLNGKCLYFIPNPIDDFWFDSGEKHYTEPIILCVGSIIERKNNIGLLKAFLRVTKKIPEAKLWFAGSIGEFAYYNRVLEMVRSLGLTEKVHFWGCLNEKELKRKYMAASIVVLFSIQETMPMALAQAMAMGKAVVATKTGGVPSMVINNKNGILVEIYDYTAFADQIIRLLEDNALCKRLGLAAKKFVKLNYQSDVVAATTVQMYKNIIEIQKKIQLSYGSIKPN